VFETTEHSAEDSTSDSLKGLVLAGLVVVEVLEDLLELRLDADLDPMWRRHSRQGY